MSREHVQTVRRMTEAWNRNQLEEWLSKFDPEGEWQTAGRFADEGFYRGHEGLERYWAEMRDDLEEMNISIVDIRGVDEGTLLVEVMAAARGKRSGALIREPAWAVVRFRDRLISRVEVYITPGPAIEAAGLRE